MAVKLTKVTYTGGVDEVVVLFPSGDRRVFKRGDSAEILPGDAATLSSTEWTVAGATPTPASEEE